MHTLHQRRRANRAATTLAALAILTGTAIATAPEANAATYKITNHGASGANILTATQCYPSGLAGDFKWLSPGYGTNHYGAGFYVDRKAKVYRNGVYVYTAYGPVTRCVGSGNWKVLVI